MIAAGLCLMGGCFAQDNVGETVDTYWPAISAAIPTSPTSIAILQYDEVSPGAMADAFFARVKQLAKGDAASFFYVFQLDTPAYNCYYNPWRGTLELESNVNPGSPVARSCTTPVLVNLTINADGASLPDFNLKVPTCKWDSLSAGERLRIIDARPGEKDFFHSYGKWGRKWFVLPMRSVLCTEAVFDFEEKVLVEL